MRLVTTGLAIAAGILLAPEMAHMVASRLGYGASSSDRHGSEAIVVLGCPTNPDGTLHPLQRWRVEIAKRTLNPQVRVVVFTGRTGSTGRTEAASMAEHARALGVPDELIVLEERAESTWENLAFSEPIINEHDVLRLVSDPLHAFRARLYLTQQNPSLAARLAPAKDYRFLEKPRWKLGTAMYELGAWYRTLRYHLDQR